MTERMTYTELLDAQQTWANAIGPMDSNFTHDKSGDAYIFRGCAIREEDLEVLAVYSPLVTPALLFTRPVQEFCNKFTRVRARQG